MKTFLIEISYLKPYPKQQEFRITASNMATATARALRDFQKENKGRRFTNLTIKIIKI